MHAAGAGRFSLAMKLVGSGARPVLQELFTSLRSAVEAGQAAADASEEGATEASLSGLCSAEQLDAIQRVYS